MPYVRTLIVDLVAGLLGGLLLGLIVQSLAGGIPLASWVGIGAMVGLARWGMETLSSQAETAQRIR
ncbi:MAG: hypothetical protein Q4P33_08795 [Flaviflexus sp.]|nr:hypothetical protein [Flaviflexus sp.]